MLIRTQEIYSGRAVKLNVETVRLPNGHTTDLEIVHHPGGAAIVAVDAAQSVCLLRQFRHAAGGYIWELPAGRLEPDEPPIETARRELIEEAGRRALRWDSLGKSLSSPGVFKEIIYLFLARDLESTAVAHEPSEVLEVHWLPLDEALRRCLNGDIDDSKTVLGLWRAQQWLAAEAAAGNSTG